MQIANLCLNILVYVVVVCPAIDVVSDPHGAHPRKASSPRADHEHSHAAPPPPPCARCPRGGRCVPRVRCPAVARGPPPECHLRPAGVPAVCCYTGQQHAAESDHAQFRTSSSTTNGEDMKRAHKRARGKLAQWAKTADKLAEKHAHYTVLNDSSPSFRHHLSLASPDKRASELGRGALLNLFAAEELRARQVISEDELFLGLTTHTDGPYCPPTPICPSPPSPYRSVGGECNNQQYASWGAANTGFERILPPDYSDGIWALRGSIAGRPLPSARAVSAALVPDGSFPSGALSLVFMQTGQFVAHDLSAGVVFTLGNGSFISCCANNGEDFLPSELQHWGCAPILTAREDPFYSQYRLTCLNFVRTQIAPAPDCSVGYAKQMNGATHHLDLSHLYGSSEEKLQSLRDRGGLLKVFNDYGREMPPLSREGDCLITKEGSACFDSGDNHANQVITLTVLHALWTREHNRVARALARLNPHWDGERLFWETRRILQAELQHIVFSEWLPMLLGPNLMQAFGLLPAAGYSSSHDPSTNPSVTSEFAAAAFRFGHSIVDGKIMVADSNSGVQEMVSVAEVMLQPSRLRLRHFLDRVLIGMSRQPIQNVDPFVTDGLSRYLFHGGAPFGLDLAALNIQRGRDWGVRSYNHYRRLIGLKPYNDFSQFTPNVAQRLSSVYSTPEDIDLWVGGLLEEAVEGGIVGPTFAHIIADQFTRLKHGDRYFYENGPDVNPGAFTPSQLAEIKKVTMSRIICDNSDGVELLAQPPSAFLRADYPGNEPVPCESLIIPAMDLSRFKEI